MKKIAIRILEYWPFISVFVMIAACIIGIYKRAPEMKELLFWCIPIGLWTLWSAEKVNPILPRKTAQQSWSAAAQQRASAISSDKTDYYK